MLNPSSWLTAGQVSPSSNTFVPANSLGSFLEFLPLTEYLSKKYTPETLPVNLIVPSLIGYGYSSAPPLDKEFTTRDNAPIFNSLMEGLGFKGYIAQGGDVGSAVSRYLAEFDSCKGIPTLPINHGARTDR
jgi:microsomal epoxide hydrolase